MWETTRCIRRTWPTRQMLTLMTFGWGCNKWPLALAVTADEADRNAIFFPPFVRSEFPRSPLPFCPKHKIASPRHPRLSSPFRVVRSSAYYSKASVTDGWMSIRSLLNNNLDWSGPLRPEEFSRLWLQRTPRSSPGNDSSPAALSLAFYFYFFALALSRSVSALLQCFVESGVPQWRHSARHVPACQPVNFPHLATQPPNHPQIPNSDCSHWSEAVLEGPSRVPSVPTTSGKRMSTKKITTSTMNQLIKAGKGIDLRRKMKMVSSGRCTSRSWRRQQQRARRFRNAKSSLLVTEDISTLHFTKTDELAMCHK